MRAVIFANGMISDMERARQVIHPEDLLIAANGGYHHCLSLGLFPSLVIGDFDSISDIELNEIQGKGVTLLRHPRHKDFTDLELALLEARRRGVDEILVLGALGARWDQTAANLLLFASGNHAGTRIKYIDGLHEITAVYSGQTLEVSGEPGDTLSLIPIGGDARGITTKGLEYPLENGNLYLGSTRGVSNVLLASNGQITLQDGILLCVLIHQGM